VRAEVEIPYPFLSAMVERAEVHKGMTEPLVVKRLLPEGRKLLAWIYARIHDQASERGMQTAWIYLPSDVAQLHPCPHDLLALAHTAGFGVVELDQIFADQDPKTLHVTPWDRHPNAAAHRYLAEGVLAALVELDIVPDPGGSQPRDRASAR
jgi:hypothetical protein